MFYYKVVIIINSQLYMWDLICCLRFSINFMNGYSVEDDIAFHLNPRVGEGQVVMNCCMGGGWGEEEREDIPSPIANREPFEVKVVVKKKKFKVWLLIHLFNKYLQIYIHRFEILCLIEKIPLVSSSLQIQQVSQKEIIFWLQESQDIYKL